MNSSVATLLNRLLALHHRSFASYLADAGPWQATDAASEGIARALRAVVFDHRATSQRLAEAIRAAGGQVVPSAYAMEFTDKNFLSLDYLLPEVIAALRHDAAEMEQIVAAVPPAETAVRELAQESLGAARGHIDALAAVAAKSTSGR